MATANVTTIKRTIRVVAGVLVGLYCAVAALFCVWVLVQPHSPQFEIHSGSLSHFNLTGPELSSIWAFEVSAYNPNKRSQIFNYERLRMSVSYNQKYPLSAAQIQPFIQTGKNWTVINVQLVAVAQHLNDDVLSKIKDDTSRGTIEFEVGMAADVRFRSMLVRTSTHWEALYCNRVKFELRSGVNWTMVDSHPRKCNVVHQRTAVFFLICFIAILLFLSCLLWSSCVSE